MTFVPVLSASQIGMCRESGNVSGRVINRRFSPRANSWYVRFFAQSWKRFFGADGPSFRCDYRKSDRRLALMTSIAGLRSIPPGPPLSLRPCTNGCRPHRVNLFRPENEAEEDSERGTPTALRFWPVFALSSLSPVAMVQDADLRNGYNAALLRRFHRLSVLANPWPTPDACANARTGQQSNIDCTESRELLYPWHPRCGRSVWIHGTRGWSDAKTKTFSPTPQDVAAGCKIYARPALDCRLP